MKTWFYHYSGLWVASEIELPEWETFEAPPPPERQDVHIHLNEALDLEQQAEDTETIITFETVRFHVPESGIYQVDGGETITVTPEAEAGDREVRLYLLGTAWAVLCYQRNLLILHASVVGVGDYAVAFCGPAGSGKSTLAAWLTTHGYPLLSDDLCRLDLPEEGVPVIYPSTPRLKLWRETLDALDWGTEALDRDHFQADKYHLPWHGEGAQGSTPLKAIYLLGWGELGIQRLRGLDSLRRLVELATYRGELLEPMGLLGEHWKGLFELVKRVPAYELNRRRDLPSMNLVIKSLKFHWNTLINNSK